jgi:hypothetical protein
MICKFKECQILFNLLIFSLIITYVFDLKMFYVTVSHKGVIDTLKKIYKGMFV